MVSTSIHCDSCLSHSSVPLFIQYIQEFSIKQGVVGSRSGLISDFFWESRGNGGWSVAGLGVGKVCMIRVREGYRWAGCSGIYRRDGIFSSLCADKILIL